MTQASFAPRASRPYLAVETDAAGLARLTASPEVAGVAEDRLDPPALAQSIPLIRANQAWAWVQMHSLSGEEIAAGALDG